MKKAVARAAQTNRGGALNLSRQISTESRHHEESLLAGTYSANFFGLGMGIENSIKLAENWMCL